MGEYSKRIGDVGEEVIADFLSLIGWNSPMRNEDIESIDKEFRKRTNGIDGYFHYRNPMVSNTVENVIYSSKYSTDPYPNSNLISLFKERYEELAKAIESFKKSTLKQHTISLYQNVDTTFDRGVLFWLNNSGQGVQDIISKLASIRLSTETNHDGIFLVDNHRIEFIYDSISFIRSKFPNSDIDFFYFNNGLNNDDKNPRNGKIMPLEYINSSVLPIRVSQADKTTVVLSVIDGFDKDDLMKYMGIAKNIGCNAQGATLICYPDYLETEYLPTVNNLKQAFEDPSFTNNLSVANFKKPMLR